MATSATRSGLIKAIAARENERTAFALPSPTIDFPNFKWLAANPDRATVCACPQLSLVAAKSVNCHSQRLRHSPECRAAYVGAAQFCRFNHSVSTETQHIFDLGQVSWQNCDVVFGRIPSKLSDDPLTHDSKLVRVQFFS